MSSRILLQNRRYRVCRLGAVANRVHKAVHTWRLSFYSTAFRDHCTLLLREVSMPPLICHRCADATTLRCVSHSKLPVSQPGCVIVTVVSRKRFAAAAVWYGIGVRWPCGVVFWNLHSTAADCEASQALRVVACRLCCYTFEYMLRSG
jgi:hypothetical protein